MAKKVLLRRIELHTGDVSAQIFGEEERVRVDFDEPVSLISIVAVYELPASPNFLPQVSTWFAITYIGSTSVFLPPWLGRLFVFS